MPTTKPNKKTNPKSVIRPGRVLNHERMCEKILFTRDVLSGFFGGIHCRGGVWLKESIHIPLLYIWVYSNSPIRLMQEAKTAFAFCASCTNYKNEVWIY